MTTTTRSNGISTSMKKAVYAVSEGDLDTAKKELVHVRDAAADTAERMGEKAQQHPVATAGLLFGAGTLFGAALYRFLKPPPTAGQVLWTGVKRGGVLAGAALMAGAAGARRALR